MLHGKNDEKIDFMYKRYELIVQTIRFRRYFAEKQRRL